MLVRRDGESRADWLTRNEKWYQTAEGKAARRAEEAEREAERRVPQLTEIQWLVEAGVPVAMARRACGNLLETDALAAMRASRAIIQVLAGVVGTGKTTAAVWWLRGVHPPGAVFVTAPGLVRIDWYDAEEVSRLLEAARLVVDDAGHEFLDQKGNYLAKLDEVVSWRHMAELPTVITTNVTSPEDFRKRYQARLWDRVVERGSFYLVPGRSMRKKDPAYAPRKKGA